jgi:hypothetical protein
MLMAAPMDNSVVALVVTLKAGDFERTVTGRFGWRSDAWQECAERVAKDVEQWVEVNRDRLLSAARRSRDLPAVAASARRSPRRMPPSRPARAEVHYCTVGNGSLRILSIASVLARR